MKVIDQNAFANKLKVHKFRFSPLVYVPANFVLQKERFFTGKLTAYGPGLHWFWFGFSQARQIKPETVDFNMQRIDAAGNQDVLLDLAVTFEIDGGLRPSDESAINSDNKVSRRAWGYNHGIHKYIKDENAILADIQRLKTQGNHTDTENVTGILESTVKDVIRKELTGKPFDQIKGIDEDYEYTDENNNKVKEDALKPVIFNDIKNRFAELGLKVLSVDFKNIKQSKEVNELEEQRKMAEKRIKIAELEAEAYSTKKIAEAKANAEAIEIEGQANANAKKANINATVEAYGDRPAEDINALNGNRVTYHKFDLAAAAPIIDGMVHNGEPVQTIQNSVPDNAIARAIKSSVNKVKSNPEVTPIVPKEEIMEKPVIETPITEEVDQVVETPIVEENINPSEQDVIILPSKEILNIEDKGFVNYEEPVVETEVAPTTEELIEESEPITVTPVEDLFTEPVIEEQPAYLSDSQVEELHFEPEQNNEISASTFFDNMENQVTDNKEDIFEDISTPVVEEEVSEVAPVVEETIPEVEPVVETSAEELFTEPVIEEQPVIEEEIVNNQDDIAELKEMKEQLAAAVENNVVEPVIEEQPVVEDVQPQKPVVEEQPKGLNLDFINSTWGRK